MHKILLSIFALFIFQSSFAADVLNFHSKDVIVYRNDLTKIDSVIFKKVSTQDSVLVYVGGVVVYQNNVVKIDSLSFSKFTGCNIPASSEVVIGTKTWTTTNLSVDKFRNGDLIPEAKTDAEWVAASINKTPAWSYYNNSVDSGAIYGKLYNWYAVTDSRGLAPTGWHVPSKTEWRTLGTYLSDDPKVPVEGIKMKNTCGWKAYDGDGDGIPGNDGNGSNTSGFVGLPSGYRSAENGKFNTIGSNGYFWSSTLEITLTWFSLLKSSEDYLYDYFGNAGTGMSVRCLRD